MSIIEQAAKRIEELSRAGIDVPWAATGAPGPRQRKEAPLHAIDSSADAAHVAASTRAPSNDVDYLAPAAASAPDTLEAPPSIHVTLDLQRLERAGEIVATDTRSILAEEFRHIKRPLLKNARGKDAVAKRLPLIAVTSALPGEGKTFCAINLAMSIATEIDFSVLLVDADVVRRDAMARLGVQAEAGLMDLLTNDSLRLEDVVLRTNVPKLSLLPAGRRHHLSTELLASGAMDKLMRRLASDYPRQIVVFDAPPLLVTSEAKVLASRVGQVVLIVEASNTERSKVARAFEIVEQCPIVMSVLNKAQAPEKGEGDGYGYGYY
jgi:protein-tyrosine kinase